MKGRNINLYSTIIITILLIALDQVTKFLATTYLAPIGFTSFIPGILQLQYVLNDGMAFGLLGGKQLFLIIVTGIALVALTFYLLAKPPENKVERFAFILILAGGVGNLIDRIRLGYVVDFFATTFMDFAVFNVADCFVTIGVILFLVHMILEEIKLRKQKQDSEQ